MRLRVRERSLQFARDNRVQPLLLLRVAGCTAQHAAGEDDVGEIRFDDEPFAETQHQHHQVGRAAAEAAVFLAERHRGPAEFGEGLPDFRAVALVAGRVFLPRLEVVVVGDEFLDAVVEHRLNFVERKVHVRFLEPEHVLGDDVLLDFVGAAVDRRLAKIEVLQRGLRLGAFADPLRRIRIERVLLRHPGQGIVARGFQVERIDRLLDLGALDLEYR